MRTQSLARVACLLSMGSVWIGNAWSYEREVHAQVTASAFDAAYPATTVQQFLAKLGIKPTDTFSQPFSPPRSPRDWMIEGSKREQ